MTKFTVRREEKNRIHRAFVNYAMNKDAAVLMFHGEESLKDGGSAQYFMERLKGMQAADKTALNASHATLIAELTARAMTPEQKGANQ